MRDYSMSINSYERPRALRRLLISLKEGDWRFDRLVVVDDASSQGSLRKISRICRNFQCDLISKRKRQYLTNSWNLGMIYGGTQHHFSVHNDVTIPKDSKFLECTEKGFDLGYSAVLVLGMKIFAIDKAIIPRILWHDERLPFLRIEDGDFVLKMKEKLGKDWCYKCRHRFKTKEELAFHQADGFQQGNRAWLDDREASLNIDYFLRKWQVDEEKIFQAYPKARNSRAILARYAYETGFVERRLDEVDFYPEVTQRYLRGNFSSFPEGIEPFADIYRFRSS